MFLGKLCFTDRNDALFMSKSDRFTTPPWWRLSLYGLLSFTVACWLGVHYHDKGIIVGAMIGIPVVIALIAGIGKASQTSWVRQNIYILLWVVIFLRVALFIWDIIDRK